MSLIPYDFRLALILGGAKSGKTAYAQALAESCPAPRLYVAPAEARDAEMAARIARHQADRGPHWRTCEEPLDLARALTEHAGRHGVLLVDCLTLWLSNLLMQEEAGQGTVAEAVQALIDLLPTLTAPVILVANEVGWGIVPDNALARRFRDLAGGLNQELARLADLVVLVAAGLPLTLKLSSSVNSELETKTWKLIYDPT